MSCVRVRVRVPEPHVNVHDPHSIQSAHPTVVVAGVVATLVVPGAAMVVSDVFVVVSAAVVAS